MNDPILNTTIILVRMWPNAADAGDQYLLWALALWWSVGRHNFPTWSIIPLPLLKQNVCQQDYPNVTLYWLFINIIYRLTKIYAQLTLNNTHSIRSYNDPHAEKTSYLLHKWSRNCYPSGLPEFVPARCFNEACVATYEVFYVVTPKF